MKYDPESRTVTITSSKWRLVDTAIEDVWHALSPESAPTTAVKDAVDSFDTSCEESLNQDSTDISEFIPGKDASDASFDSVNEKSTLSPVSDIHISEELLLNILDDSYSPHSAAANQLKPGLELLSTSVEDLQQNFESFGSKNTSLAIRKAFPRI